MKIERIALLASLGILAGMTLTMQRDRQVKGVVRQVSTTAQLPERSSESVSLDSIPEPISLGVWRVTAYCPCDECINVPKWRDGHTASNYEYSLKDRFCAAPKSIPFGTVLKIPGYGRIVPVLDRGGSIKGKRLDVFFETHQLAKNWGVQMLEIKQVIK